MLAHQTDFDTFLEALSTESPTIPSSTLKVPKKVKVKPSSVALIQAQLEGSTPSNEDEEVGRASENLDRWGITNILGETQHSSSEQQDQTEILSPAVDQEEFLDCLSPTQQAILKYKEKLESDSTYRTLTMPDLISGLLNYICFYNYVAAPNGDASTTFHTISSDQSLIAILSKVTNVSNKGNQLSAPHQKRMEIIWDTYCNLSTQYALLSDPVNLFKKSDSDGYILLFILLDNQGSALSFFNRTMATYLNVFAAKHQDQITTVQKQIKAYLYQLKKQNSTSTTLSIEQLISGLLYKIYSQNIHTQLDSSLEKYLKFLIQSKGLYDSQSVTATTSGQTDKLFNQLQSAAKDKIKAQNRSAAFQSAWKRVSSFFNNLFRYFCGFSVTSTVASTLKHVGFFKLTAKPSPFTVTQKEIDGATTTCSNT